MLENFLDWITGLFTGGGEPDVVASALTALVKDVSDIIDKCLPFGIALLGLLAGPRLIKRIIHSFL